MVGCPEVAAVSRAPVAWRHPLLFTLLSDCLRCVRKNYHLCERTNKRPEVAAPPPLFFTSLAVALVEIFPQILVLDSVTALPF